MKTCTAIGLMSGSSLDGVDLALVRFDRSKERIRFNILSTATLPYPEDWQQRLADAFLENPDALDTLNLEYGHFLGKCVAGFARQNAVCPDFVASHGHTVFHQPEKGFTLQIGNGQAIADACRFQVINDFRSEDMSKGGQGAPLVPIGDRLLFSDYEMCLNIGGIANISYEENGQRTAYDICIANQALNFLAQQEGFPFDRDGNLARSGKLRPDLLNILNNNAFFTKKPPKSLGREFFEHYQKTLLCDCSNRDLLATFAEHIAIQTAQCVAHLPKGKILATGGGALNTYLMKRIAAHTKHTLVIPDRQIVDYKEALVFALLGMLRIEGGTNVLSSVTGGKSDSCSGRIWAPK